MKKFKKGFTLIELLVVVAIIGILASVVLASLNTARSKGTDAAIKANLTNTRAQAAIFYDTANTYTGVCAATGTNVIGPGVLAAAQAFGITSVTINTGGTAGTAGSATVAVCAAEPGQWAAAVPLKQTGTQSYFCVDSAGAAKVTTSVLPATTATLGVGTVCP